MPTLDVSSAEPAASTEISALVDRFKAEQGGWLAAADYELARLVTLEHYHKRRNTVVALVDARLAGRPEEDVWRRSDTCSRNTYHSKWKRQPLFVEVLASVEQIARTWTDSEELQALRSASRRLALASPAAASKAVEQLDDPDANVVLRAAFGILDRAGKETASKSSVEVGVSVTAAERIAAMQRALAEDASTDLGTD